MQDKPQQHYWRAHIRLLAVLLGIWFLASFGAGILLVDWLNQVQFAGFKLGFWFAQQGGIYTFIALVFFYSWRVSKLEVQYRADSADTQTTKNNQP